MCPLSCIQIIFFLIKQVAFREGMNIIDKGINISSPTDLGLPSSRLAGGRET